MVHGAVSTRPLWHKEYGRKATSGYSTQLVSWCPADYVRSGRCARVPTFSISQLQANLSARVGRPAPFSVLVIDCEHCWGQLQKDEAAFLRSPQLEYIFYELDEKSTSVVREICSFGFGVVSAQIDCLLPRSNLAQLVFKRDPSLPCLERHMERHASCTPTACPA